MFRVRQGKLQIVELPGRLLCNCKVLPKLVKVVADIQIPNYKLILNVHKIIGKSKSILIIALL